MTFFDDLVRVDSVFAFSTETQDCIHNSMSRILVLLVLCFQIPIQSDAVVALTKKLHI